MTAFAARAFPHRACRSAGDGRTCCDGQLRRRRLSLAPKTEHDGRADFSRESPRSKARSVGCCNPVLPFSPPDLRG